MPVGRDGGGGCGERVGGLLSDHRAGVSCSDHRAGVGTAPPRLAQLAALCGTALRRRSGGETALPALGGWCLRDGADSDN